MIQYSNVRETGLSKAQVSVIAESLAPQLGFGPGDNISVLISRMGGQVLVEDTLLTDPEQTGSLLVDAPDHFRVIIPSHTSMERDRFTIAHELGHYVLHYLWQRARDPNYPERVIAFRQGSHRLEWEANWFAAAFLMPADTFRQSFGNQQGNISAVADDFSVSVSAASVRARGLALPA